MTRPTVWVIKEQMSRGPTGPEVMDYTPAMEYGDIRFITTHDLPLYPGSTASEAWKRDVQQFAVHYDETKDWIITTGQPIAIFMVGFLLARAGAVPRFLVWRREEGRYRPTAFN